MSTEEKSINIQYVVVLVKIMGNFREGVDGVGALFSLLAVRLIADSDPLKPCGSFLQFRGLHRNSNYTLLMNCVSG